MGLIRGGLIFLVGALLLISLIAGNIFLTGALSLDSDVVKPEIVSIISNSGIFEFPNIDSEFLKMQNYCSLNNADYVFNTHEGAISIPCETVLEGKGSVINYSYDFFADKFYSREYDCGFFSCISEPENFTFYISEDARDFFMKNFYYTLLFSLILLALILFFSDPKSSFFTLSGILILISSLPVFLIGWALNRFDEFPLSLLSLIASKSMFVFLITFILGVVLIAVGFAFKFWSFGYRFYESTKGEKVQEKVVEKVVYVKKSGKKGKR